MSLLLSFPHFSLSSNFPLHHHSSHHYHHHNHHCNHRLIFLQFPNRHSHIKTHRKTLICQLQSTSSDQKKPLPESAIQRIADKLRTLGFEEERNKNTHLPEDENDSKVGEIFIPNSRQIPKLRVGHTLDTSWSTPQNPVPDPGSGGAIVKLNGLSRVAKKERKEIKEERENADRTKVPSLAELTLSGSELRRLTTMGIKMKQKMKLGKAGITEGIVNGIHERWRSCEVVKIVCEDICRLNMKRTHDLLEVIKIKKGIMLFKYVHFNCNFHIMWYVMAFSTVIVVLVLLLMIKQRRMFGSWHRIFSDLRGTTASIGTS